jgi:hypothetical protein
MSNKIAITLCRELQTIWIFKPLETRLPELFIHRTYTKFHVHLPLQILPLISLKILPKCWSQRVSLYFLIYLTLILKLSLSFNKREWRISHFEIIKEIDKTRFLSIRHSCIFLAYKTTEYNSLYSLNIWQSAETKESLFIS